MSKKILPLSPLFFFLFTGQPIFAGSWVPVKDYPIKYPVLISGVHRKGSDTTEPRASKSQYLKVNTAGVILIPQGAGFFINVELIQKPASKLYFRVEYPNPADPKRPLVNDAHYEEGIKEFRFSSPDLVWALNGYHSYLIKIYVYENEKAAQPIDVLKQRVRSYVDTFGDDVLIYQDVLEMILKE